MQVYLVETIAMPPQVHGLHDAESLPYLIIQPLRKVVLYSSSLNCTIRCTIRCLSLDLPWLGRFKV